MGAPDAMTRTPGRTRSVLVLGATGFLGRHCVDALARAGFRVICGSRHPPGARACHAHVPVDFELDVSEPSWAPKLDGVDAVVNAVGIAAERQDGSFDTIHHAAPRALFGACATRGVQVVQVSALGADAQARSRFHLSKRAADDYLLAVHGNAVVVQPSLVFGPGGTSATLFSALASLPLVPLPGDGRQQVQPVHVDDVAAAIVAIVRDPPRGDRRIALVGPQPVQLRELLSALRERMGFPPPRFVQVPMRLARWGVRVAAAVRPGWLSTELLDMLERGNTADPAAATRVLGYTPQPAVERIDGERERIVASAAWLVPLLRLAIAITWLAAAAVSFGLYPLEDSVALVERTGLHGTMALAAVYAGAAVDAYFGIASLLQRNTRYLWMAQIAVVVAYTVILTIAIPETWLHPFGPLVKNVPILVAILLVSRMSPR
jgi:nucleoside-diphosphate-sugar epimerase